MSKPSKQPTQTQKDKVVLPDNVVSLISQIVQDIDQVKTVVEDIHSGTWPQAVTDLLTLVGNIVNNLILPKVLKESEASGSSDAKPQ